MKREIRANAIVNLAGVGAIVDVGAESFLMPGIQQWPQNRMQPIDLRRLSSRLKKSLKKLPDLKPDLLVNRFPRALFCENCRTITTWTTDRERPDEAPQCDQCLKVGTLVPMRFVLACKNGHLDDFNWGRWAHSSSSGNHECGAPYKLQYVVAQGGNESGLNALRIKCVRCGSFRSLEGISAPEVTKQVTGKCRGTHPWLSTHTEDCDDTAPQALQRGASNLYYATAISALDIPDAGETEDPSTYASSIVANPLFAQAKKIFRSADSAQRKLLDDLVQAIATIIGCSPETVRLVLEADAEGASFETKEGDPVEQDAILREELEVLLASHRAGRVDGRNFVAVAEPIDTSAPRWFRELVSGILLIERLREVRVFRGFQRISPSDPQTLVRPDVGNPTPINWLPASETFGEGIFLSLSPMLLEAWTKEIPKTETEELAKLDAKKRSENLWFLPRVTPRLFAVHSLSHLLLRQLSFECGYSAAALRERLYVDLGGEGVGLLIYTSEGDADGSLGGLVRQGKLDRIVQTMSDAVEQGRWCSADPVCTETAGQGLGGLNRASCHACTLVAETSCTCANALLDRRYLVDESWGLVAFAGR